MRFLKLLAAALALSLPTFAQSTPQVPLTGNIGPAGAFPLFNSGTIIFTSDANHTMVYPEFTAVNLKFTSAVPLTATRNLITPAGMFQLIVENATEGGQAIQVIGPSGTGVTIPNGGTVLVWNDGTNYIQVGSSSEGTAANAPTATPIAGSYTSAQAITLVGSTPNSVIYYTTDGTTPTTASSVYSAPINVASTGVIKAFAVAPSYLDSTVASFAYTITTSSPSHMELASLGQNANLNGALPFVGSAAYANVTSYSVDTANNQYVQTAAAGAHLDVSQPTGSDSAIPYYILNSKTDPRVFWVKGVSDYEAANPGQFDPESDHAMIPLVPGIQGEGGVDVTVCRTQGANDNHGIIIDVNPDNMAIYEAYNLQVCNGIARYYSLTVRNLNHPFEIQGPRGRTSSDVAGMVITPIILGTRYEDYTNGAWNHTVRWTMHLASKAPNGYATLFTGMGAHGGCGGGNCNNGRATMFGQRMRLKASYNCTTAPNGQAWSAQAQITCIGLKTFGVVNGDNGINMAVQGAYDSRWGDPGELNQILITDFETIVDPSMPNAYAAQVIDETPTGGTSTIIDQTNIFDYSQGAGPTVSNPAPRPTIVSFTPSSTSVAAGHTVTFNYVATNATVAMIDSAGGTAYGNSGSITWLPTQTDSYRLTVLGEYGWITGDPVSVTLTGPAAPAPTSNVPTGTYTTPQTVTLSNSISGSQIHYTLDGTTPTTASAVYSGPLTIANNGQTTINAITTAISQGYVNSSVSTFNITLNLPNAAAPVFSPAPGTYSSAQNVTMTSATSGAGIYYTTDGTTPTASSSFYSGPVAIPYTSGVQTRVALNAAAIDYGYATGYTSGTYLVGTQGPLNGTLYNSANPIPYATGHFGQAATFTGASSQGFAYLPPGFSPLNTTDGFTMDAWIKTTTTGIGWIIGNGDEQGAGLAIAVRYGNFMAYGPTVGEFNSGIAIDDGNWHYVKATFSSAGIKTFVDGVAGATTTSVPSTIAAGSTAITQYEIGATNQGRFEWPGSIDEISVRTGVDNSLTVPTAPYTGSETGMFALYHLDGDLTDATVRGGTPVVATPTFSPAAGTFTTAQTVTIATTTSGSAIYYTTDGTTPTTSSSLYSGPLTVSATTTVKALATHSGYTNSSVGVATYTISGTSGAPAYVGSSSSTVGLSYSPTATYTYTAGNMGVILYAAKNASSTAPVMTCNGTTATLQQYQQSVNQYVNVGVYTLPGVTGGSTTCTVPSGVNYSAIIMAEYSGATRVESATSANTGSDPAINCGSVTTTGATRLIVSSAMTDAGTLSAASGYSQLFNDPSNSISQYSLAVPSASTNAVTVGSASTDGNTACVAFALAP